MTPSQYEDIGRQIVAALVHNVDEVKDLGEQDLTVTLRDHRRAIVAFRKEQEVMRVTSTRTIGRGD